MSAFQTWLESLDQRRTVLLEVDYLNAGTLGTLYLSNRPFISDATDSPASTPYDDVILGGLTYSREMGGQVSGSLGLSVGSVTLAASSEIVLASSFEFAGQAVRVYLGDQRWQRAHFQRVAVLTCEALEPINRTEYALRFRTERLDLDEPLNLASFTSGKNTGALKPICFGVCRNVRPVQLDDAGLIWAVHDGEIAGVSEIRINGVKVTASVNLGAGTITLTAPPKGTLTADVTGGGGTSAKSILTSILSRLGFSVEGNQDIDLESLSRLPVSDIGLYSRAGMTYRQAFDAILRSFAGFWGFTRLNVFKVGRVARPTRNSIEWLTPDDIVLDGVTFDRRIRPASSISVKFARNYTLQDVAGYDEAFSTSQIDNSGILSVFPDAEFKEVETLLSHSADAEAEAERRNVFFSSPLKTFIVRAFALPFAYEVGQVIRLSYPYFNMGDGVDAVIVALFDDPLKGVTRLKVLVNG